MDLTSLYENMNWR